MIRRAIGEADQFTSRPGASDANQSGEKLKSGNMRTEPPTKLVIIATVPETLVAFMSHQVEVLNTCGFEVHTITSPGLEQFPGNQKLNSIRHEIAMTRGMSPGGDLVALYRLWRTLRQIRPAIVQTRTPKAGFLGMIASWAARVPVRVYTIDGLPILTQGFLGRIVLSATDFLACALATEVLCVSRSVRRFMVARGLCSRRKARVLGVGGLHGIDIEEFNPDRFDAAGKARIRAQYGIPESSPVICYVGRLVPDKGIAELATAWRSLRTEFPEARLLLCGYFESAHPVRERLAAELQNDPRVHITGKWLSDMPPIYAAADVCVLPTYREGLSTVALEAAAMAVPIVATRVPGCVDAIRNGSTGLLVRPRSATELATALREVLQNPTLARRLGIEARTFISQHFCQDRISQLVLEEYRRLIRLSAPATKARTAAAVRRSRVLEHKRSGDARAANSRRTKVLAE